MSSEFKTMDKELIVDVVRRRVSPSKNIGDFKCDKGMSMYVNKAILNHIFSNVYNYFSGSTLEHDLALFLKSGGKEFSDINLVLDGTIIPAHKSILAARCAYFQALFRSFMPPDKTVNVRFF